MDRRQFLTRGAVTAGVIAAGPFQGFLGSVASAAGIDYGPIGPVADLRDGAMRLELPGGFNYRSFHHPGDILGDGTPVPARGDGMAAFRGPRGTSILVRNQEINGPVGAFGNPALAYDPMTGGGTVTTIITNRGEIVRDHVSLNGTQMNCAGGPTPWGSWLSCEETVNGGDVGNDFTGQSNVGLAKHGYVFEVPTHGRGNRQPIRAAGRFAHEAAAVDPASGIVYLTEDNFGFPSGFYRYSPPRNPMHIRQLKDGGVLQMLKVVGSDGAPLHNGQAIGASYAVEWVTIADPDPTFAPGTTNDQAIVAVGDQGRALGAALFSRLEGCNYHDGRIYFVSTQGGANNPPDSAPGGFGDGRGQVWSFEPSTSTLDLVFESPGSATLDLPDNVVASPSGVLVLCEDGPQDNFLRGLTPDGNIFDFARNVDPAQTGQEFAGATFSPDGATLFVNIQSGSGYTMAIWGPWENGPFA